MGNGRAIKSADLHLRVPKELKKNILEAVAQKSRETGMQITVSQYVLGLLEKVLKRRH